ncbi:RES family NAD+ phosphorylase [Flavobacterium pectinovorum]|nr:RES family NAD+ phosphorylase [Flavobacterium pectinovorum]
MTAKLLSDLAYRFFVKGTSWKVEYGEAPLIQFNEYQKTSINFKEPLKSDVVLIEKYINVGFFDYGPRLWMIGHIEPLKKLQTKKYRKEIIQRIIQEYPSLILTDKAKFYRLRKNPKDPENHSEYDSPPKSGNGRLDSYRLPILYASPDLEVCIHECRATAIDRLFVSALVPKTNLKLLNLAVILEEDCTEFESLDISVQFLFYAESHSYEISREIAKAANKAGYDGIVYPSYFIH